MTSQTKHYIDVSDILALRFECAKCKTSISFLVGESMDVRKLGACPNCGEWWANIPLESTIAPDIRDFIESAKRLMRTLGPDSEFSKRFSLTLEIAGCDKNAATDN
jgi:hypothetical protein